MHAAATILYRNEQIDIRELDPAITMQFSTLGHTGLPDADGGYRVVDHRESLLSPTIPRPNAGLLPAVYRVLGQTGVPRVTVQRSSPAPADLGDPDETAVRWLGPCDTQLIALVRSQDHGLVRHASGVDLAWLIAQILIAFPQATSAIVVASLERARRLRRGISRWVKDLVVVDARPSGRRVGRIVIGTPYGMAHDGVELNKRQLVVFPRALDALQERAQTALMTEYPHFRLFGFVPTDCRHSPSDRDWLRATFGFAETTIPHHGLIERPVRVLWFPIAGGPPLPAQTSTLELKRLGIWHHPVRNRRLCRVAADFSRRSVAWLRQTMPEAAAGDDELLRVVVLVEAVEHALALASCLNWPLITGDDVIADGLDRQQRRLLTQRRERPNLSGPVIATTAGLARIDINSVDVLLWAGADCTCRRLLSIVWRAGRNTPAACFWSISPISIIRCFAAGHAAGVKPTPTQAGSPQVPIRSKPALINLWPSGQAGGEHERLVRHHPLLQLRPRPPLVAI